MFPNSTGSRENEYVFFVLNLPRVMMELHPCKSIVSWKYSKSKMNLIHLTCRSHDLTLPTLSVLRTLTWAGSGQNHLTQSLCTECWLCHAIYQILYWQWDPEWLSGYRMVACRLFSCDLVVTGSCIHCCCWASQGSIVLLITSSGEEIRASLPVPPPKSWWLSIY